VNPDKVIEPGSQKVNVKPGSIEDVSAVGNRDIGGRGVGNWYSTDYEIKMGRAYAAEVEKSTKLITDPVITEYVNRIGQNIVKNSDCKVPFTIKVIDSDEINAFALPGGFFYVNSGLILNADEEAELAGVMAHETAHVCAHHAMREMTRLNYAQIGMVPGGRLDWLRHLRRRATGPAGYFLQVRPPVRGAGRLPGLAIYVSRRLRSPGLHHVL
jgi:predicted Zn-dependent protease